MTAQLSIPLPAQRRRHTGGRPQPWLSAGPEGYWLAVRRLRHAGWRVYQAGLRHQLFAPGSGRPKYVSDAELAALARPLCDLPFRSRRPA